jgi:hypothetical protein
MKTLPLNTYAGISSFAHALSRTLKTERNFDLKGTKLIHDIAKSLGYADAHHLKSVMDAIEKNTVDGTVIANVSQISMVPDELKRILCLVIDKISQSKGFFVETVSFDGTTWEEVELKSDLFFEVATQTMEDDIDNDSILNILCSMDDETHSVINKLAGDRLGGLTDVEKNNVMLAELSLLMINGAMKPVNSLITARLKSIDPSQSLEIIEIIETDQVLLGSCYKDALTHLVDQFTLVQSS